jgi:hypothetical protein
VPRECLGATRVSGCHKSVWVPQECLGAKRVSGCHKSVWVPQECLGATRVSGCHKSGCDPHLARLRTARTVYWSESSSSHPHHCSRLTRTYSHFAFTPNSASRDIAFNVHGTAQLLLSCQLLSYSTSSSPLWDPKVRRRIDKRPSCSLTQHAFNNHFRCLPPPCVLHSPPTTSGQAHAMSPAPRRPPRLLTNIRSSISK